MIVINLKKWSTASVNKRGNRFSYRRIYFKGKWTPFVKRVFICVLPRKWKVR